MLVTLSLAAGLSWASGLRLYLAVFVTGLLGRFDVVALPHGLHVLMSEPVLTIMALLAILEFCADKIPTLDSLWDAVHTLIRIPAGALLAVAALAPLPPTQMLVTAGAAVVCTGAAHMAKSGARALINFSSAPMSNRMASLAEDFLALGGLLLAFFLPLLFLALLVAFLLVAVWALPRLWLGVTQGWRAMSSRMVAAAPVAAPIYRPSKGD